MVYAVSMDNNFGENINNVWNKKPVINENFGSIQMKRQPSMRQEPIQQQPIQQQPIQQQPIQHLRQQPLRQEPIIHKSENPENVAFMVTGMLFLFISWIAICCLIYSKGGNDMYFLLALYFCSGIAMFILPILDIFKIPYRLFRHQFFVFLHQCQSLLLWE